MDPTFCNRRKSILATPLLINRAISSLNNFKRRYTISFNGSFSHVGLFKFGDGVLYMN